MRIYDAWRKHIISTEIYTRLLEAGNTPDTPYNGRLAPSVDIPEVFYVTGISTEIETEIAKVDAQGSAFQNIAIKNTGSTNSLSVRLSYMVTGNIEYKSISDIIAPGNTLVYQTQDSVFAISVYAIDYSIGNHTTFEFGCSLMY
jgi:hypothetical protein